MQCLVLLALLWWCWSGFAVLGNLIRTDQGIVPAIGFVTIAAAFVLALSLPKAFVDRPGGLYGPLVFATCYFVVRVSETCRSSCGSAAGTATCADAGSCSPCRRCVATALIVVAGLLPQRLFDGTAESVARLLFWIAALGVEYGAGLALRGTGWTVLSAGHWAERHGQIVLIALGESIIALGFGPSETVRLPLTWPVLFAAVLGIAVVAAMWWAYFDTLALGMEQTLHRTRDPDARAILARNAYSYLHLPVIAGIILFALGLKGLIARGRRPQHTELGRSAAEPLDLLALYGGVALYLLALIVLRPADARRPPLAADAGGILLLVALVPVAGSAARADRAGHVGPGHDAGRGRADGRRLAAPAPGSGRWRWRSSSPPKSEQTPVAGPPPVRAPCRFSRADTGPLGRLTARRACPRTSCRSRPRSCSPPRAA